MKNNNIEDTNEILFKVVNQAINRVERLDYIENLELKQLHKELYEALALKNQTEQEEMKATSIEDGINKLILTGWTSPEVRDTMVAYLSNCLEVVANRSLHTTDDQVANKFRRGYQSLSKVLVELKNNKEASLSEFQEMLKKNIEDIEIGLFD